MGHESQLVCDMFDVLRGIMSSLRSLATVCFSFWPFAAYHFVASRPLGLFQTSAGKRAQYKHLLDGVRAGSSDRPRSMYMMCPGDVGRDSGEWGGQESEVLQDWKSHQELGEEALAEGAVLGVGTENPKVLSDCCWMLLFLKNNYCCCPPKLYGRILLTL